MINVAEAACASVDSFDGSTIAVRGRGLAGEGGHDPTTQPRGILTTWLMAESSTWPMHQRMSCDKLNSWTQHLPPIVCRKALRKVLTSEAVAKETIEVRNMPIIPGLTFSEFRGKIEHPQTVTLLAAYAEGIATNT